MKIKIFLFGCCLFFGFLPGSLATDGVFTGIYERIGDGVDGETAEIVAGMLKTDPQYVTDLVLNQRLSREEQKGVLLDICRFPGDGKITDGQGAILSHQENECLSKITILWEKERNEARKRKLAFEESVVFARWWDGVVESKGDFDILDDIHKIDRQLFDSDADEVLIPRANKGIQDLYLLSETGYRLPADVLPFQAQGGCGAQETSLYGGIVCIPKFCTDFICVRINAIPGRAGAGALAGAKKETSQCGNTASARNIICEILTLAYLLKDKEQITPTRNTNVGNWYSQIFNLDQIAAPQISVQPKTPPFLHELIPPDEHSDESKKKEYEYEYTKENGWEIREKGTQKESAEQPTETEAPAEQEAPSETPKEGAALEADKHAAAFRSELLRMRNDIFKVCPNGGAECTNEDIVEFLLEDCNMLTRSTAGPRNTQTVKCIQDKIDESDKVLQDIRFAEQNMLSESKKEFYTNVPAELDVLWRYLREYEETLTGINLCKIREMGQPCGSQKNVCDGSF